MYLKTARPLLWFSYTLCVYCMKRKPVNAMYSKCFTMFLIRLINLDSNSVTLTAVRRETSSILKCIFKNNSFRSLHKGEHMSKCFDVFHKKAVGYFNLTHLKIHFRTKLVEPVCVGGRKTHLLTELFIQAYPPCFTLKLFSATRHTLHIAQAL